MSDTYFYQPNLGHGLPHDPFKSIIGPRPIGWISSKDKDGVLNLAPYSFFNAFENDPLFYAQQTHLFGSRSPPWRASSHENT